MNEMTGSTIASNQRRISPVMKYDNHCSKQLINTIFDRKYLSVVPAKHGWFLIQKGIFYKKKRYSIFETVGFINFSFVHLIMQWTNKLKIFHKNQTIAVFLLKNIKIYYGAAFVTFFSHP